MELIQSLNKEQNLKLYNIIANRLLARLNFILLKPKCILELNFVNTNITNKLFIYYPKTQIYSLVAYTRFYNQNANKTSNFFYSNSEKLPLTNNSIDLILSNLAIKKSNFHMEKCFKEFYRVMNKEGVLLFSMLNEPSNNSIELLQHVGNLLLVNDFNYPVIDRELININTNINNQGNAADTKKYNQYQKIPIEIIYGYGTRK